MANWWDEIAGKGSRERLRDYYDYAINQNIQKIGEDYGKAKSEFNRGLFQRGMQRSSYGAATNANYDVKEATEKSNARTAGMAEAGRELGELEQWEKEYNEKVRQFNEQLELSKQQLAEQQRQFDEEMAWNREQQEAKAAAAEAASSGGGGGGYTTTPTKSDKAYLAAQQAANGNNASGGSDNIYDWASDIFRGVKKDFGAATASKKNLK